MWEGKGGRVDEMGKERWLEEGDGREKEGNI
jgi:hypothetical protein